MTPETIKTVALTIRKSSRGFIARYNQFEHNTWVKQVQTTLENLGFVLGGSGCTSVCYISKTLGIAVKISGSMCGVNSRRKEVNNLPACLKPFWVTPLFCTKLIMIQPLVDTRDWPTTHAKLAKLVEDKMESSLYRFDIHGANVGMLNGKPVFFDFSDCRSEYEKKADAELEEKLTQKVG